MSDEDLSEDHYKVEEITVAEIKTMQRIMDASAVPLTDRMYYDPELDACIDLAFASMIRAYLEWKDSDG